MVECVTTKLSKLLLGCRLVVAMKIERVDSSPRCSLLYTVLLYAGSSSLLHQYIYNTVTDGTELIVPDSSPTNLSNKIKWLKTEIFREFRSFATHLNPRSFFVRTSVAPVAQRYHVTSDTLGREFDPGKRDFSH